MNRKDLKIGEIYKVYSNENRNDYYWLINYQGQKQGLSLIFSTKQKIKNYYCDPCEFGNSIFENIEIPSKEELAYYNYIRDNEFHGKTTNENDIKVKLKYSDFLLTYKEKTIYELW